MADRIEATMMATCCRGALAATLLIGLLAAATRASAGEIGPDADFCAAVRALPPGDELVLRPGEYRGPCTIRRGGQAGAPLVIRAADPGNRPHLAYDGAASNVLNIRASHVTIRGLAFGPTRRSIDGVKIYAASDVVVEDCEFSGMGGIAVSANHRSIDGLVVRRNVVRDSRATAMYFGCHDGATCAVSGLLVERNLIRGVTAPDPEIGYGIQVKLNSSGAIRGNVVLDTKGPGIMVYGATDSASASLIERNVVSGSRHSAGIVVAGGPTLVRNNVVALNAEAGIDITDYGRRGLLRQVIAVHNSILQRHRSGIALSGNGVHDVTLAFNAIRVAQGGQALPTPRAGLRLAGNVDCSRGDCYRDPGRWDFSPSPQLVVEVAAPDTANLASEDFFGAPRGDRRAAGAIERPSAALHLDPLSLP